MSDLYPVGCDCAVLPQMGRGRWVVHGLIVQGNIFHVLHVLRQDECSLQAPC